MKRAKDQSGRRGACITMSWICGVLALLTGAMWIAGNLMSPSVGAGGVCALVSPSQLQLALANQPVEWAQNRWYFPNATAAVIMPGSVMRPTMSEASMTVGTQTGAIVTISLRVVNVPLWQLLVLFLIAGGVSWRFAARMFPIGHCSACGYDLRGLGSGKCPECGEGFLARAMAKVRRVIEPRRGIMPRRGASWSRA
ncbi:MAG: hypothetical protein U0638_17630 [Phycisphaerales bacterium]